MKKQLVFILSSNYSGSHFLSLLLGSHSKAIHLGETKNIINNKKKCYLCKEEDNCLLFKGTQNLSYKALYPELSSRAGDSVNILIDTSKKTNWAKHFVNCSHDFDIKVIHLVRDPRALLRRWANNYQSISKKLKQKKKSMRRFPKRFSKILFSSQETTYLYKWLFHNQKISEFIKSNSLDYHLVTYRDLTTNTEDTLTNIMSWLGSTYEPSQLNYWEFDHHGTQKKQYDWVQSAQVTSHIDLRWKRSLTKHQSDIVSNNIDFMNYLDENALYQVENGLTLTSQ